MLKPVRIISLIALLVALCWNIPLQAQTKSVTMLRRDAVFTIAPSGSIDVVETWETQFHGGPFRSATRTIPVKGVDDIINWSVAMAGQTFTEGEGDAEAPNTYQLDERSDEKTIKWFFGSTSDSTLTFILSYRLENPIRVNADGDQLFWTVIEADRAYPVEASRVELRFPSDLPSSNVLSASYLDGVQAKNAQRIDSRTLLFESGRIEPNQKWEVRAQLPHGFLQVDEPAWQWRERMEPTFTFIALFATGLTLLLGFVGIILSYVRAKKPWAQTTKAEYRNKPPAGLPPTAAGMLLDRTFQPRHLIALFVDLTRRGVIAFERESDQIKLSLLDANHPSLLPIEKDFVESVFYLGSPSYISFNGGFHKYLTVLKPKWEKFLSDEGYYKQPPKAQQKQGCMRGIVALGAAFLVSIILLCILIEYTSFILLTVMALLLVALVYMIVAPFLLTPTKKGAQTISDLRAFERYLTHIQRFGQIDQAQAQFSAYLPYAIAFGQEGPWIKAFSDFNIPAPAWYSQMASAPTPTSDPHWQTSYPSYGYMGGSSASASQSHDPNAPSTTPPHDSAASSGPNLDFDTASSGAFTSLNAMSAGFFSMLNDTASSFSSPVSSSSSSSDSSSSSSSDSGWSFSSDSSSSSSDSGWSSSDDSGGGGSSSFD